MNSLFEIIGNSKYDFVGPLTFAAIIFIGILIGFWNGYKTATFFFVLNIFCFAGTIAIFHFSKNIAEEIVPNSWKIGKVNISDLLKDGLKETAQKNPSLNISNSLINENKGIIGIYNIVGSLFSLATYFVLNVFLFMPLYFFFRKSLKESIFENKKTKVSNFKQRLGGAAVGLVISFPIATIASALLTPLGSESSGFVKIISEISSIIVAKQASNIPQNIFDVSELAKSLK